MNDLLKIETILTQNIVVYRWSF